MLLLAASKAAVLWLCWSGEPTPHSKQARGFVRTSRVPPTTPITTNIVNRQSQEALIFFSCLLSGEKLCQVACPLTLPEGSRWESLNKPTADFTAAIPAKAWIHETQRANSVPHSHQTADALLPLHAHPPPPLTSLIISGSRYRSPVQEGDGLTAN